MNAIIRALFGGMAIIVILISSKMTMVPDILLISVGLLLTSSIVFVIASKAYERPFYLLIIPSIAIAGIAAELIKIGEPADALLNVAWIFIAFLVSARIERHYKKASNKTL